MKTYSYEQDKESFSHSQGPSYYWKLKTADIALGIQIIYWHIVCEDMDLILNMCFLKQINQLSDMN